MYAAVLYKTRWDAVKKKVQVLYLCYTTVPYPLSWIPDVYHYFTLRGPVVVQKRQTATRYCARTSFLQEIRARSSSVRLPVPCLIMSEKRDSSIRERQRGLRCRTSYRIASWKAGQCTGSENEKRGFSKRESVNGDTGLYSL